MELLANIDVLNIFLHLDTALEEVFRQYHTWIYLILFAVIFCETGLVATPFLPGDSLLFASGALAAKDMGLEVQLLLLTLASAAILGDSTNYWIGRFVGPRIFSQEKIRLLNKRHLDEAHAFYQKHGGKTIIIARFLPIFRTFAPFVAGIGKMYYLRFLSYSVFGTLCWINLFVLTGFFFGNIKRVKENFTLVIMAIIVISVLPAIIGAIRSRKPAVKPGSEA